MEKDITNVANYLTREAELAKVAKQPGGMQVIANLMMKPLVRDLLHESRVRQVFATYQLGLGEEAYLDADVSVKAFQIAMNGLPEAVQIQTERVHINTTPISVLTKTRWNESNYRKYDILTRAQERSKSAVMSEEDVMGFGLLEAATTDDSAFYNSDEYAADLSSATGLTIEQVASGIAFMSEARINPNKLIINPRSQKNLLMLHSNTAATPLFMAEQSNENMKKGLVGKLWNLNVLNVPNGESISYRNEDGKDVIEDIQIINPKAAYIVSDPEKVGVMAIRTDLTVETQKMVEQLSDLFVIWEDLGFLVKYTKGMMRLDLAKN